MHRFSHRLRVGLGAALLAAACAGVTVAQESRKVEVGKPAPSFDASATQIGTVLPDKKDAKKIKLKDFENKKHVVLFFYPKAMTRG